MRAAVANGASDATIIFRHILPNMTLDADRAGDGDDSGCDHRRGGALVPRARRPAADAVVGRDARRRAGYLTQAPRLAVYPGLAIFFCSLSFNLLGDGLRDVLDPRTTR